MTHIQPFIMFTRNLVLIGLSIAIVLGTSDIGTQKFSKQVTFTGINSVTVPIGNRLYVISKNETHLRINSTDKTFKKWSERCIITINPEQDHIDGKMQASVSSGFSDNVIAIWGVKNSEIVDVTRKTNYTFLLIKPLPCLYESLTLPEHEMPANDTPLFLTVTSFSFGFNAYYYSNQCLPCDITSKHVSPSNELKIDNVKPSRPFLLRITRLLDGEVGFFNAYNFYNGTAVARLLTLNYEIVQKKFVDHLIEVADTYYSVFDEEAYISFCYGNGTQQVFCEQFDEDLELRFRQQVSLLPHHFASSLTVKIDRSGHSFVGLIQSPLTQGNGTHKIHARVYNKNGEIIKSLDFGEIEPKYTHNELSYWIFLRERQHCIHVIQMEKPDDTYTNEIIKCIKDPLSTTDTSSEFL